MNSENVWLRRFEVVLLAAGLLLVTVFVAATLQSRISAGLAVKKFEAEQATAPQDTAMLPIRSNVDLSLWSDGRRKGYLESLVETPTDAPQAVLRVPKLHLEVPVYEGSDEPALKASYEDPALLSGDPTNQLQSR